MPAQGRGFRADAVRRAASEHDAGGRGEFEFHGRIFTIARALIQSNDIFALEN
jgi:hypothetical protein